MSFSALKWAYDTKLGSSATKSVLICLANCMNEKTKVCCPAIETICRMTELAEVTVRKALSNLAEIKLLKTTARFSGRRCTSNQYALNVGAAPQWKGQPYKFDPLNSNTPKLARAIKSVPDLDAKTSPIPTNLVGKPESNPNEEEPSSLRSERACEAAVEWERVFPEVEPPAPQRKSKAKPPPDEADFEAFYAAYPRKQAKAKARKAFVEVVRAGVRPDDIMRGLERFQFSQDPRFQPHPASWLKGSRWTDEPDIAPPGKMAYLEEIIARGMEFAT